MAVSGCPRNCAESIIKDFGVVAIDGGWELYVGGNGGVKVRAAELLVKVKTNEEVLEWNGAFLQYYREHAKWNERTSEWIERIGIQGVRDALESKEVRLALVERIEKTLSLTVDPWKEIIEQEKLSQTFQPLQACELGWNQ
jgi:nitrite reductase (NADH) large subunit